MSEQFLDAATIAVMSDLHMGAGNCVLDQGDPDNVGGLTRFLADNGVDVDTFVLLGDVFDLALATYGETVSRAKRLVEVLAAHCRKIVYVPGNHDHHMWLLANDNAEIVAPFPECPAGFVDRAECDYGDSFLAKIASGHPFQVCYPNVYWRPSGGNGRTFVMHHGHFCEDTYTLVSDIYRDAFQGAVKDLNAIEGINAGWVELVWYHLGQAGKGIGADGFVENLYEQIKAGKTESLEKGIAALYGKKLSPLVHQALADAATEHWYITKGMAEAAAGYLDRKAPGWLCAAIKRAIRSHVEEGTPGVSAIRGSVLDDDLAAHCKRYLELTVTSRGDLGNQVALIFGHTHRFGTWPKVEPVLFNDGGWIQDDGSWPDAYLFHIDSSATLKSIHFGPGGRTLSVATYALAS
jgi:predicted phosphodiesterase